ncbi:hypothetical protein AMECASPLE_039497 [Ameca splendens]|uniref:Uncharacterized protein n=1 Tax=Ameca splendens TaxID=208324 RepID=A0ABV0ZT80_9TELE
MYCRTKTMSMQEIQKYAQMAWETRARPTKGSEGEARVLQVQTERNSLALEDQEMPSTRTHVKNRFMEQRRFGETWSDLERQHPSHFGWSSSSF